MFIGNSTFPMRLGRFLMPTLFDKITYWKTTIQEFEDKPVPKRVGNLFEPQPEKEAIRGGWLKKRKKKRWQKAALLAGGKIGAGWIL